MHNCVAGVGWGGGDVLIGALLMDLKTRCYRHVIKSNVPCDRFVYLNVFMTTQEDEEEEEDIDRLFNFHKMTMSKSTSSLQSSKVSRL